jgi:type II secretory pathway pseudopilin PulG
MAGRRNQHRSTRGFLLVELLVGLVIVALVMLGAAAILQATASGWNDQDITRSTQMQANQTYLRVQKALEGAKYVGYSSSSPGTVFFWQTDNFGGVENCDPYIGEMALLQFDSTTNTLWLYTCLPVSQMSASQQTAAKQTWTLADINLASTAAQFATSYNFVQKQALGGPGDEPNDGTRMQVEGFNVTVNSLSTTTQLPVIEYSISFLQNDGTTLTLYNTTTIKGPTTQPE